MYYLLIGKLPFFDENQDDLVKVIKNGNFDKNNPSWKALSKQAKDLILKLL